MARRDVDNEDLNNKARLHSNQPYDESLDVRDGDNIPTPSPRLESNQPEPLNSKRLPANGTTASKLPSNPLRSSPLTSNPLDFPSTLNRPKRMSENEFSDESPRELQNPDRRMGPLPARALAGGPGGGPAPGSSGGTGLGGPPRGPGSAGPLAGDKKMPTPSPAHARGAGAAGQMGAVGGDEESGDEDDDDDDEESSAPAIIGAYNPTEYEQLAVSPDIKELFSYITRYQPVSIELEHRLKPFIPEYIPAIGDLDAFLKVERPEMPPWGRSATGAEKDKGAAGGGARNEGERREMLGLNVLDEPAARQSDPTLLEMQLRTFTKQSASSKSTSVKQVEDAERNSKQLEGWIRSIGELHKAKPLPTVVYKRPMPSVEQLMQEWPAGFEEALRQHGLPPADIDADLATYADLCCGLLDIPVYKSRVESLHLLFSLYLEFKNSEHFRDMLAEKPAALSTSVPGGAAANSSNGSPTRDGK